MICSPGRVRCCVVLFALAGLLLNGNSHAGESVDLTGAKGRSIFFALGMLDAYSGRQYIEDTDIVERFYCNEHIQGFVFEAYLRLIGREQGIDGSIRLRMVDCLMYYHSRPHRLFLDSFYPAPEWGSGYVVTEEGNKRSASTDFSYEQFDGREQELKFAYMAGAYFRYGEGNGFRFANAGQKVRLIERLLLDVGCANVGFRSTPGFPAENRLSFDPTEDLVVWLERMPGPAMIEAADSLAGLATQDELAIYREVIKAAQEGAFDGCALSVPCVVGRVIFIHMAGGATIEGDSKETQEAIDDYNANRTDLVSLRDLASDSVRVVTRRDRNDAAGSVSVMRIGFDKSARTAVTFVAYRCAGDVRFISVAAFARKTGPDWAVTHYAVQNLD